MRKRDLWKAESVLVGLLLLLVYMVWLPVSSVTAQQQGTSGRAVATGTVTVQATPTVDATATALNKEKLKQEVQQLQEQNEPDLFGWLRTNAAVLLSTLVVVIGGLIGLFRWLADRRDGQEKELKDRQNEREKRAEERFQAAVTGLGDEKEGARIGAAILLRTFLRPSYEQFYIQTFDLTVANLRLSRTPHLLDDPDGIPHPPENQTILSPVTTLSQALVVVFKESFPLARNRLKEENPQFSSESLDASRIRLDAAYLHSADLEQIWMPEAFLLEANLSGANLSGARLVKTDFSQATLGRANLSRALLGNAKLIGTDLMLANLSQATLGFADLSGANLMGADLSGADLRRANLSQARLGGANLMRADLSGANLMGADLSAVRLNGTNLFEADLSFARLSGVSFNGADLRGAKLSGADLGGGKLMSTTLPAADLSGAKLKRANLTSIKGLTKEQLAVCKAEGAIISDDPTTSASHPTVAPSLPPQSNETQASSAPPAQERTPPPDPDGSSPISSPQLGLEP